MFSYYGSKSKLARYYPLPKHELIIEPFAGAAWYSMLHFKNQVILNEINQTIYNLWKWLVSIATKETILKHVNFYAGENIRTLDCSQEQRDLIGFYINRGSIAPKNIVQKWCCTNKFNPNFAESVFKSLKKVADNLDNIRHWKILYGTYTQLPDIEATWFIDPPYQFGGEHYINHSINYSQLANWCLSRKGQIIICENSKATWLPFTTLKEIHGQRKKSIEVIYTN